MLSLFKKRISRSSSLTKMEIGNIAVLLLALSLSVYASTSILAASLAFITWLLAYDTFRPLHSKTTPKDFDHAKSRIPGEQLPPPYPDGWYNLCFSFELKDRGQVKSVRALGREFVVWRGHDGNVAVFGAYCPHLGANLAIGGIVEDNCLKCPFHGWRFDMDGRAKDAPGCGDKAPYGRAESYLCVEKNQMILIWMEGKRDAPRRGRGMISAAAPDEVAKWDVPDEPFLAKGCQFVGLVEHQVMAHIQEIPENGADGAHLTVVHAPFVISSLSTYFGHDWLFTWTPAPEDSKDSHTAVVRMDLGLRAFGRRWDALTVRVFVTQVGPALVHEELTLPLGLGTIYFASSVTPVKPLLQRYTHVMWCSQNLPRFVAKVILRGLKIQVDRDVPIWNNKMYRNRVPYTKVDSNIPLFRRWFKQFYSEHSETFQEALAAEKESMSLDW